MTAGGSANISAEAWLSRGVRLRQLFVVGTLVAMGLACRDTTGPSSGGSVDLVASVDSIAMIAIGETRDLAATVLRRGRTVAATLTWFSAADSVATVTPFGRATSRGPGSTQLFVVSDLGGLDSVHVRVTPAAVRLRITTARATILQQRQFLFAAEPLDSAGVPTGGTVPITWSVTPSARATISANGLVTAKQPGSVLVRAMHGAAAAETTFTVLPLPALRFTADTIWVGRDLVLTLDLYSPPLVADSAHDGDLAIVTLTVTDTTIVRVATELRLPPQSGGAVFQFSAVGLADGITRMSASAPGWTGADAWVVVRKPVLRIARADSIVVALDAGVSDWHIPIELLDPAGVPRPLADGRWFDVRSLDTTVLKLASSPVWAGSGYVDTSIRPQSLGTSRVVAEYPGWNADTVTITVIRRELYFRAPEPWGAPLRASVGFRHQFAVRSVITGEGSLPIQLSQRSPDVVSLVATTGTLGSSGSEVLFALDGLSMGLDTLFVSAGGVIGDTLVVEVSPGAILAELPESITLLQPTVYLSVRVSGSSLPWSWFPPPTRAAPVTLRVVSGDTTILRVAEDEYTIPAGGTGANIVIEPAGSGTTTLTIDDPLGSHTPLVLSPITIAPVALSLYAHYGDDVSGPPEIAMGTAIWIGARPEADAGFFSTWRHGRFRSSNTDVLRVRHDEEQRLPGSALVYAAGGEGSAWIVAEGRGFVPESVLVHVRGKPRIGASTAGPVLAHSTREWGWLHLLDRFGRRTIARDTIAFRLSSTDAARVGLLDTLLVLPALEMSATEHINLIARHPGWAAIVVEDTRPPNVRLDAITIGVKVLPAPSAEGDVKSASKPLPGVVRGTPSSAKPPG